MTPYEKFMLEKQGSGFFDSMSRMGERLPGAVGGALAQGAAGAAVGAGVAGIGLAASKIYDAMTKQRDFKQMLDLNPDLVEHHQQNPKMFNTMFSTLRNMNPEFSRDPLIAGTYMRRMAESPLTAGGIAIESLSQRDNMKSPVYDAFMRGGQDGVQHGLSEGMRPPSPNEMPWKDQLQQKGDLERMKHQVKHEHEQKHPRPQRPGRP